MSNLSWTFLQRAPAGVGRALRGLGAGVGIALFGAAPVMADDTEIFAGAPDASRPNIVLIIDTSGSMDTDVDGERELFNPERTYQGTCRANSIYWVSGPGNEPDCVNPIAGANNFFNADQLTCDTAVQAIAAVGYSGRSYSAQWDPAGAIWNALDPSVKDRPVECAADAGVHGQDGADTRLFAADQTQWTSVAADAFTFGRTGTNVKYRFYSSDWLNWLQSPPSNNPPTRLEVVQQAARGLVRTASGVSIGLMRYSSNDGSGDAAAEGGMVTFPVSRVESSRDGLAAQVDAFNPSGFTPLTETLFEARQYFAGGNVVYGVNSQARPGEPLPSVPESRTGAGLAQYLSPATQSCQRNFVVYLTDGLPTSDASADGPIESLIGGACNGTGAGRCLDDLAGYMFDNDQRTGVNGMQSVATYTVGFGPDVEGSPLLADTARRGGGLSFSAGDSLAVTRAFDDIIADAEDVGMTFVAPAVAVNAFNRTETLSDVYLAMFEPGDNFHWAGNLKKYRFNNQGELVGNDLTTPVVNADGLLDPGSRSIWSGVADGADVKLGGAANELQDPANRRLYTFLGSNAALTDPSNAVQSGNLALTTALLGLGGPGQPSASVLIDWARGFDVLGADPSAARRSMGDPLHSRAAVVVYGGTQDNPDAVVFTTTNDGYLHAIDTSDGSELWSFIPADLLNRLPALFANQQTSVKQYGLDGELRALRLDLDRNGTIDGADKVYLYFGMGRGGSNYYALDVTSKNSPRHLWTLTPGQLPGVGQTWSPPTFTRIDVRGVTQDSQQIALVFGGGYDPTQDNDQIPTLYNADTVGNRLFMVDAINGNLLWYGGGAGVGEDGRNLVLPRMNNSIPAGVRIIDLDNDTFADRMYAADTGGRVWRFDIVVDADPGTAGVQVPDADDLVTGGRFATLGAADSEAGSGNAATRRFYNTPDVALVRRRATAPYFNVALGSGWRGHPLNTQTQDHFFSLRDYAPFTKFTQTEANSRDPIVIGDLTNITNSPTLAVPDGNLGWRLELSLPNGFEGEKVLAESRTFNNQVLFPTYLPRQRSGGACAPIGSNRVYAVNIDNGSPVQDINRDGETTPSDRYTDLALGGIAPAVSFYFYRRENGDGQGGGGDDGGDGGPPDEFNPVTCASGWVNLTGLCSNGGTVTRTYWKSR